MGNQFDRLNRLSWALKESLLHGVPRVALTFYGGLGDSLLLTAPAHELKQRQRGKLWIMSTVSELFRHNPDVDRVVPSNSPRHLYFLNRFRRPLIAPNYAPHVPGERRDIPPSRHLLAEMCHQVGLRGKVRLRPYLHLSPEELRKGRRMERQIAFQTTGRSAQHYMWTKEWYPERFQQVAGQLQGRFNVVQLGHASDPRLDGALDLRGKTTLRESAAVLANSVLFVGLVGFLMHLARAVDCPAVIVYGGRELPSQSGYPCNENLTGQTACAPCWRYDDCPGQRACMNQIQVEQVVAAIHRRLADPVRPLVTEEVTL